MQLIRFGRLHRKPLSIPEWGLSAVGHKGGAGDNPFFVHAIAWVVRHNVTAYHSYFESTTDVGMLLTDAPRSLAAYRRHFGADGDSLVRPDRSTADLAFDEGEDEERVVEVGELPVHRLLDRVEGNRRVRTQAVARRELERALDLRRLKIFTGTPYACLPTVSIGSGK